MDDLEIVRSAVVASLSVEPERVRPEARLVADLGAGSLDLLDIVYRIQEELGLRAEDTPFRFLVRLDTSSPQVVRNGLLLPEVLEQVRPWLPALDELPDPSRVRPVDLLAAVNVETLVRMVRAARA